MKKYIPLLLLAIVFLTGCPPKPTDPIIDPTATPVPQPTATPNPSVKMEITFVDVGQGDVEYIVLPNGKNVLIDGGPSNSSMSAFATQKGLTKVDYVVLTHPHADHLQGLNWVFDNLQVNNFYDTRLNNSGASGDETLRAKAAAESGCTTYYPSEGENLAWDSSVTIKVLHAYPNAASSSVSEVINSSSITLMMTCNGKSILFTGDIQSDIEANLVSTYGSALKCNVLKVAHHGSSYSSTDAFLNLAAPETAYIEVGAGNTYGHPAADALSRLTSHGATVYRTDQNGTMTINF